MKIAEGRRRSGGARNARDIAAITVNRWPDGYSYTYNSLANPVE